MSTTVWAFLLLVPGLLVGLALLLRRAGTGKKHVPLHVGRELADEASSAIVDVAGAMITPSRQTEERGPAQGSQIQRIGPRWRPAGKPDR